MHLGTGLGDAALGALAPPFLGDRLAEDFDQHIGALGHLGRDRLDQHFLARDQAHHAALARNDGLDQTALKDGTCTGDLALALDQRLDDAPFFDQRGTGLANAFFIEPFGHRSVTYLS